MSNRAESSARFRGVKGLNALHLTDWKRWIATLCVVLVAFVLVEQGFSSDTCRGSVSYNIAALGVAAKSGDERPGSPSTPIQAQHHCCAAHPVAVSPVHDTQTIDQVSIRVTAPPSDGRAPNGEQSGQDRPPRVSGLV
jgi:hypothetical protein